jgi:hypothetical protein
MEGMDLKKKRKGKENSYQKNEEISG